MISVPKSHWVHLGDRPWHNSSHLKKRKTKGQAKCKVQWLVNMIGIKKRGEIVYWRRQVCGCKRETSLGKDQKNKHLWTGRLWRVCLLPSVEIKASSSYYYFFSNILLGSQSTYPVLELGQPRHRDFGRVQLKEK